MLLNFKMFQTNRVLQKEQAQLFAIQKKLEKVLPVVQEALNSLKVIALACQIKLFNVFLSQVEELHLKSMGIRSSADGQGTRDKDPITIDLTERPDQSATETTFVNSQEIDLGVLASSLKTFDEEVDSD